MEKLALFGRSRNDGQRHGETARLHCVRHGEDDVVESRRAIRRDIAGQRDDLVLGAFHRRNLLNGGLQRPTCADGHDDRFGRSQEALDLRGRGLGDTDRGGCGSRVARNHLHQIEGKTRAQALRQIEAACDRMVDADLHEPFGNGKRHQPLGRLARHAELGRDLVLGVAGDIVEPPRPRRVVEPAAALLLLQDHLRSGHPNQWITETGRRLAIRQSA